MRLALAITLGKRGDKSAGAYLLNRLESAEEHNRRSQGLLLKQVYKKDFGTDAQQWRAWLQANGKL